MWTSPESCEFWLSPMLSIEQMFLPVKRRGTFNRQLLSFSQPKELLKEFLQLLNHPLLLFGSGAASAEPGYRRHQLINVRPGGLDLTVTEGILQKLSRLRLLEFFFLNDLDQFFLPLPQSLATPPSHHPRR